MAKREKNPASDKTGNDTSISLLVLGIVSVIFALWIPIVGIVLGTVSLVRVRKRNVPVPVCWRSLVVRY